ncbi:hypothetical protein DE4576_04824 [Mycobacterium marinum]|nr:hypothetical protein DE4576_04824 [Mycobacterium marinum]
MLASRGDPVAVSDTKVAVVFDPKVSIAKRKPVASKPSE